RQAERVEHFNRAHVDPAAVNPCKVERKEVQVVIRVQRVTIELDIAFDLQVLARFKQRPGRSRKAHASYVEVRKPRAALVEDVIDPGKYALAGLWIALFDEAVYDVIWQSVAFNDDKSFCLGE